MIFKEVAVLQHGRAVVQICSETLRSQIRGTGSVADQARLITVAYIDHFAKAFVQFLQHAQIGTDAERKNRGVHGDLIGTIMLCFAGLVLDTHDIADTRKTRADIVDLGGGNHDAAVFVHKPEDVTVITREEFLQAYNECFERSKKYLIESLDMKPIGKRDNEYVFEEPKWEGRVFDPIENEESTEEEKEPTQ